MFAFTGNYKWINNINKLGRVGDRIPILQLGSGTKNKRKTKPRYESRKMVLKLKLDSGLEWKIVETIKGSYKLNCD